MSILCPKAERITRKRSLFSLKNFNQASMVDQREETERAWTVSAGTLLRPGTISIRRIPAPKELLKHFRPISLLTILLGKSTALRN